VTQSFPIYILPFGIVHPEGNEDVMHVDFWEQSVAPMVAQRYDLPLYAIKDIPYAFKRARIVGDVVYYGENMSAELLSKIRKALKNPRLRCVYDEHEARLPEDVAHLRGLISPNLPKQAPLHYQ